MRSAGWSFDESAVDAEGKVTQPEGALLTNAKKAECAGRSEDIIYVYIHSRASDSFIFPDTHTKRQISSQPKSMDGQPPSTELHSHPSLPGHRSPGPSASQNAGIEYLQTLVFIAELDLTMFSTAFRSKNS
jgi:hypothetical protein